MSKDPGSRSLLSSPREIRCDAAELRRLLEAGGSDPAGAELMSRKARWHVIRVDGLKAPAANILKQEMLSVGGDCATHREVILGGPAYSSVHLLGSRRQLRRLIPKLAPQPFGLAGLGKSLAALLARLSAAPKSLTLPRGSLSFDDAPLIMGILNITPDSFSDGARFAGSDEAVAQGLKLVAEGADLLDVGGESTRPGAEPVTADEEKRRVLPVIEALVEKAGRPVSVDTRKAAVAAAALALGAQIVNDVSALGDAAMAPLLAESGAALVLMHMRGSPESMQNDPRYEDPVDEIYRRLEERVETALATGIERQRLMVDPGIGFGKRVEDNTALIRRLGEFHSLGLPVVLGASRKSFLGQLMDEADPARRLEGSLAAAARAADQGAQILRVHDVSATRRFLDAYLPLIRAEGAADSKVNEDDGEDSST